MTTENRFEKIDTNAMMNNEPSAELVQAAENGDAQAQYKLAQKFELHDNGKYLFWLEKSAAQNNPEAMYTLASEYDNGYFEERDGKKAFEMYLKCYNCAENGSFEKSNSARDIAEFYTKGRCVEQDYKKALEWYKKVNDPYTMYSNDMMHLGKIFEEGVLVEKDIDAAVWCYSQIGNDARTGKIVPGINGLVHLAEMYRKGNGVEKDEEKALYYENLLVRNKYSDLVRMHIMQPVSDASFEDFMHYYKKDFRGDLMKYFNFEFPSNGAAPFVMKCFEYNRISAFGLKDMFRNAEHYFFFATAMLYTIVFPYVLFKKYGHNGVYREMLKASGWPQICVGMAGVTSPVYTMEMSGLLPTEEHAAFNRSVIEMTSEYMVNDFIKFLEGNRVSCDARAYRKLVETVKNDIEDIREQSRKYIEDYKSDVMNPGAGKDCRFLFTCDRYAEKF